MFIFAGALSTGRPLAVVLASSGKRVFNNAKDFNNKLGENSAEKTTSPARVTR